jgi:hypothetical protein
MLRIEPFVTLLRKRGEHFDKFLLVLTLALRMETYFFLESSLFYYVKSVVFTALQVE